MTDASIRTFLQVQLFGLLAYYVLFLSANETLQKLNGATFDLKVLQDPFVEDMSTTAHSTVVFFMALSCIGLVKGGKIASTVATIVTGIWASFIVVILNTIGRAEFYANPLVMVAPLAAIAAYGVFVLFQSGFRFEANSGAKSHAALDTAYLFWQLLGVGYGAAALFDYTGFLAEFDTVLPSATGKLESAFAQYVGGAVLVAGASGIVAYNALDKDSRTWLAGVAYVLGAKHMLVLNTAQSFTLDQGIRFGIPVLSFYFIMRGIRLNLGTEQWEAGSGFFGARNATFVLIWITWLMSLWMTYFPKHAIATYAGAEDVARWLPAFPEIVSAHYRMSTYLLLSSWLAWVTNVHANVRVGLLVSAIWRVADVAIWALNFEVSGMNQSQFIGHVLFSSALGLYALSALHRDIDGQWGAWFKELFHWSYEPLKGGAYWLALIYILVAVIGIVKGPAAWGIENSTPEYATPEFAVAHQITWLSFLLAGVSIYLHTRAADHQYAGVFTWFLLGNVLTQFVWGWFFRASHDYVSDFGTKEGVIILATVLPVFAAIFYRAGHKAKSSPKKDDAPSSPRGRSRSASGRRRKN